LENLKTDWEYNTHRGDLEKALIIFLKSRLKFRFSIWYAKSKKEFVEHLWMNARNR
jgi:hypothetical protein